jgi:hypothetical protein
MNRADKARKHPLPLIDRHVEGFEMGYLNARERGVSSPVVAVLDLRDTNAREAAEHFLSAEQTSLVIELAATNRMVPLARVADSAETIACAIGSFSPDVANRLEQPQPAGQF